MPHRHPTSLRARLRLIVAAFAVAVFAGRYAIPLDGAHSATTATLGAPTTSWAAAARDTPATRLAGRCQLRPTNVAGGCDPSSPVDEPAVGKISGSPAAKPKPRVAGWRSLGPPLGGDDVACAPIRPRAPPST